jgi:spermidine/putrescine transport system ATP-binding protein
VAQASFADQGADLELSGIRKEFPGFLAIDDLDLVIPAGSFFALLGPSGCGKTTTLRIVAGLEPPTSGSVLIGGKDVTHLKAYRRPVNTVFQSYALFPHLSVLQNVAFGLKRRHISSAESEAHEALRLVELDHVSDRKPQQLSGGQQQRVALARAIVNRPSLLLLDEPLGALDLKLRRQMQIELKKIQSQVGLTFVHVTHDQEEAMTMADTVAVMNHGRIEQMGAPADLYELPKTAFVADFLGQSNLFRGNVVSSSSQRIVVDVAGESITLPSSRSARDSGDISVGMRPEKAHMHLGRAKTPSDHNALTGGRVTAVSYSGVSTQYTVNFPSVGTVLVFQQNADSGGPVAAGTEVSVSWPIESTFGLHDHRTIDVAAANDKQEA